MSTDVLDQIRQLAEAFDEFVHDVTVDEVTAGGDGVRAVDQPVRRGPRSFDGEEASTRWRRLGLAAAAVMLVAGLVVALGWVNRDGSAPASSTPPSVSAPTAISSWLGQFVWPAPAPGYATVDELVAAFTTEVLGWESYQLSGTLSDELEPQAFTLDNTALDSSVSAIAIPSPEGWGFVQIGDGLSAELGDHGEAVLVFPTSPVVASSTVTAHSTNGIGFDATTTSSRIEIPAIRLEQLASALVVGFDAQGRAVTAAGGQFGAGPTLPGTVAPTTPVANTQAVIATDLTVPLSPLDYAGTTNRLPLWPYVLVSDPPATTTGYGMQQCDGGYGTKVLRVDPSSGPSHSYSGTLCVFVDLAQPRHDAITSCATTTGGFNYARCQRRTDETDTAGPGSAVSGAADTAQQAAIVAFPTATRIDQPELFATDLSGALDNFDSANFSDGTVSVTLNPSTHYDRGSPSSAVCATIQLAGASVNGCADRPLLATGLAYGAFQDGDGPIEIVGIVPDEVTAIDIDGTRLTPVNNVWHYTATAGTPLTITVRSADGRTAATLDS